MFGAFLCQGLCFELWFMRNCSPSALWQLPALLAAVQMQVYKSFSYSVKFQQTTFDHSHEQKKKKRYFKYHKIQRNSHFWSSTWWFGAWYVFGLARRGSTFGFHLLWHIVELAMRTRLCLSLWFIWFLCFRFDALTEWEPLCEPNFYVFLYWE